MLDKLQSYQSPSIIRRLRNAIGRNPSGDVLAAHRYPHIWERQKTSDGERIAIAPRGDHVNLMLALSEGLPEPFGVLYVLTVSRTDCDHGRYQAPQQLSRGEAVSFFNRFQEFFEQDGRHHIWLMSIPNQWTLVYDHHNIIFAYGDPDYYEGILRRRGLSPGEVRIPHPHAHCFNGKFDPEERAILSEFEWIHTPLQAIDDDRITVGCPRCGCELLRPPERGVTSYQCPKCGETIALDELVNQPKP